MIRSKSERITRVGFYQRARYSYAVVEKENIANKTKEFIFFERGKFKNKWIKKLYSPHFKILYSHNCNKFRLGDITKNKEIILSVYFYIDRPEAMEKLLGLIAKDRLDQAIQTLNDWTNETLNVDCKLREKVKALLDTIDNYEDNYEVVK